MAQLRPGATKPAYQTLDGNEEGVPPTTAQASSWYSWRGLGRICLLFVGTVVILLTSAVIFLAVYNWFEPVRASCEVEIAFRSPCIEVQNEIVKRVHGQSIPHGNEKWWDPHNNGTYVLLKKDQQQMTFHRISGSASKTQYTDLVSFKFTSTASQKSMCHVTAASTSTVFSILDFGTNFCNINDLYCNNWGCRPFTQLSYTYKVGKCTESDVTKCYTV